MERLKLEIALLEIRTEQLRIHLRSLPFANPEARQVLSQLGAMTYNGSRQADPALACHDDGQEPDPARSGYAGIVMPNKPIFIFECDRSDYFALSRKRKCRQRLTKEFGKLRPEARRESLP
jgi:hypothetical protein